MKKETHDKKQALIDALVATYGDQTVVTRKQILVVYKKNKEKYAHYVNITKNKDHKVERGKFVIIQDMDKTIEFRDDVLAGREKQKDKLLDKKLRNDPIALAKELMKPESSNNTKKNKKNCSYENSEVTFDDINDFMGGDSDVQNFIDSVT